MMSLLLISTTATADKTYKAREYKLCFDGCDLKLDYDNYFLVHRDTLKRLNRDAKAYQLTLKDLLQAQTRANELGEKVNMLQSDNYVLKLRLKEEQQKVYNLSRTPWYKHPGFWVTVGFAVGIGSAAAVTIAVLR
jgi:hypothetical protein